MTEKERQLRQDMAQKQAYIQDLLKDNRLDEAESATNELKELRRQFDVLQTVADTVPAVTAPFVTEQEDEKDVDMTHVIAQLLRNKGNLLTPQEVKAARGMAVSNVVGNLNEGTNEQGGFIVPVDAQTKINELKRTLNPLSSIVRVENVNTMSGTRVMEKAADITAFAPVAEFATIGETDAPKFTQVKYLIKKYAGILPMSEELLADTDQDLLNYVYRWLAKKSVITENAQILALLKTLTKAPLTSIDSVKDVLNV
ncbi:MAG: phage major capsid protein, partial [Megasphaera micronuciformis]|nr:phage major capsid protein [Megasphaera micronuciformis]